MSKFYTGVGARDITGEEAERIMAAARYMAIEGYTCRSGKAKGSDKMFAIGTMMADEPTQLVQYTPKEGFNSHYFDGSKEHDVWLNCIDPERVAEAKALAMDIHPKWGKLNELGELFHTRNIFQVEGEDKVLSTLLLACSYPHKDGYGVQGGTRTAWICAKRHKIPCFNIRGTTYDQLMEFLHEHA